MEFFGLFITAISIFSLATSVARIADAKEKYNEIIKEQNKK